MSWKEAPQKDTHLANPIKPNLPRMQPACNQQETQVVQQNKREAE